MCACVCLVQCVCVVACALPCEVVMCCMFCAWLLCNVFVWFVCGFACVVVWRAWCCDAACIVCGVCACGCGFNIKYLSAMIVMCCVMVHGL